MTYKNMVILINNKKKDKEYLLMMCDIFLMNERIDEIEYQDLIDKINEMYDI
jgi:hypothetical protein